jgi:hypothetical protein
MKMWKAATPQFLTVGYELGTGHPELGIRNTGGYWGFLSGGGIGAGNIKNIMYA